MGNFKPVIGFDDNLSNHLQNYSHTAYAVSKMRAGRTPKNVSGETIIDANALFRPGLYYMEEGSVHLNNDGTTSTCPIYVYNIVQDPDESLHGGHALEDASTAWHLNVPMHFRQIAYACTSDVTNVTTRIGTRDASIANLGPGTYKVIPTVQQIYNTLKDLAAVVNAYAYVKDIAMWIRYTIDRSNISNVQVTWVPAITWDIWKSISGGNPVELIDEVDTDVHRLAANMHYVVFGQHTLILPYANTCSIGAKIVIDQWKSNCVVRAYNEDETVIINETEISPCIANVGLSDINIHGDEDLAPEGVTFTKNTNQSWSYTNGSITYTVEQVTLKPNTSAEDGKVCWAVTFIQNGIKYLKRITPNDVTYPFGASVVYTATTDEVVLANKTYYEKVVNAGIMTYNVVSLPVGSAITSTLYEASSSISWYDVTDKSATPYVYKQPSDISQAEIITTGTKVGLTFSVTDVTGNIVNAGQYTFEVTYDTESRSNRIWVLERCSDFEALMNRVTSNIGATVTQHTETLTSHDGRLTANEQLILQYRNQYFLKEYPVRITVENVIYGDNAKVSGETLIVFDEGEYLDRSNLTTTSYIINYMRARLTPVYTIAAQGGTVHTFYLPTKMAAIVGKKIKFLLEPEAALNVVDDNSAASPLSYSFTGYHESTSTVSDHPKMTEIIFEVVAYKNQSGTESYAWTYQQRLSNSNNSITTQDISDAIALHDRSASCHSGLFVKPDTFSSHTSDAVVHITSAERFRWERMANSGATSNVASAIASQYVSIHNADPSAHADKITDAQLTTKLQGYVTGQQLTTVLSNYVETTSFASQVSAIVEDILQSRGI